MKPFVRTKATLLQCPARKASPNWTLTSLPLVIDISKDEGGTLTFTPRLRLRAFIRPRVQIHGLRSVSHTTARGSWGVVHVPAPARVHHFHWPKFGSTEWLWLWLKHRTWKKHWPCAAMCQHGTWKHVAKKNKGCHRLGVSFHSFLLLFLQPERLSLKLLDLGKASAVTCQ